jgi:hypothetical protein
MTLVLVIAAWIVAGVAIGYAINWLFIGRRRHSSRLFASASSLAAWLMAGLIFGAFELTHSWVAFGIAAGAAIVAIDTAIVVRAKRVRRSRSQSPRVR